MALALPRIERVSSCWLRETTAPSLQHVALARDMDPMADDHTRQIASDYGCQAQAGIVDIISVGLPFAGGMVAVSSRVKGISLELLKMIRCKRIVVHMS